MSKQELHEMQAKAMLEKELQREVEKRLKQYGWLYYHTWNSKHSKAGFPDIVAIRRGWIIFAELKRQDPKKGALSEAQEEWKAAIETSAHYLHVWRPLDLLDGTIDRVLQ